MAIDFSKPRTLSRAADRELELLRKKNYSNSVHLGLGHLFRPLNNDFAPKDGYEGDVEIFENYVSDCREEGASTEPNISAV